MDALTASGEKLEGRFEAITQAQVNANYRSQQAAESFLRQRQAVEGASNEVQKILNRYDPLGTKLRQLQSDFAALDKAIAAGATGGTSDSALDKTMKAMNDEIAKTKGLMQAAGAGADGASLSMSKLGLNTAFARRELIVLGHEAMQGNFSRMPGSFLTLAGHSNILSLLLSGTALAIGAVAAAAGVMAVAFVQGHTEVKEMNRALAITSNYSGMTRGDMIALAGTMSETGAMTIGTAKSIVTTLVNSGQISSAAIGSVAALAHDYSEATGKDIAKIAGDLIKLFDDPVKGAAELNKQMHFLSSAELEHIDHLVRIGQLGEAQLELAQKLKPHLEAAEQNLGTLESAWNRVWGAATRAWDGMRGIGRPKTLQDQLKDVELNIKLLEGKSGSLYGNAGVLAEQKALQTKLLADIVASTGAAAAAGEAAATQQANIKADALAKQTSEYAKIYKLQEDIQNLRDNATPGRDTDRAILDKQKQITDIQRAMGAEGRAIQDARMSAELKTWEIDKKGYEDTITFLLKTGEISTKQANEAKQSLELRDIYNKRAIESAKLLQNLTPQQRITVTGNISALDVAAANLPFETEKKNLLDIWNLKKANDELDIKAREATATGQTKINDGLVAEIEKLKEHNAEIGKTKEQVETLRALEMERQIAKARGAVNDAQYEADQSSAGQAEADRLRATLELLKQRQALLQQGSVLEATAAATKAYQENWKQANNEVSRYLADAIMRGFDKGETFAKNFMKSLENGFKTLVLTPIVRYLLSPVTGAVTSAMTGMGLSGAGGIGNGLSLLSSGSNSGLFGMGASGMADYAAGFATTATASQAATAAMIESGTTGFAGAGMEAGAAATGSMGFAAAVPYVGAAVLAMYALGVFDSDERQKVLIGSGITGKFSNAGFTGYVASNWGTPPNDRWGGTSLDPVTAQMGATISNTVKKLFSDMEAAAKGAGYAVSGLDQVVVDFTTSSQNGDQTQADLTAALNATSDAIALKIMPNLAMFQLQGETLGQTFSRMIAAINAEDAALKSMSTSVVDFTAEVQSADPAFTSYMNQVKNFDANISDLFTTIDKMDLASAVNAEKQLMQLIQDKYKLENDYLQGQKTAIESSISGVSGLMQSIILGRATPANQVGILGADFQAKMNATKGLTGVDLANASNAAVTAGSSYVSSINSIYGSSAKAQQLLQGVLGDMGSLSGSLGGANNTVVLAIKDNQAATVEELKRVVAELKNQTDQLTGVRLSTAATAVNTSNSGKTDASASADAATELARAKAAAAAYNPYPDAPGQPYGLG